MTPLDDRDPVDVLAEEFADRLRRGERPSVGGYAAAHPEHADQLRELLPAVAQIEQLKKYRSVSPQVGRVAFPDRFGDFRIVRELGRGGMGVVFEAVQESLGRKVALKVLASHAPLDAERRERFVREAKAAARLHHTNIVPVFGVGEHDGLPYYVMQLIPGQALHAVVAGWRQRTAADTDAPIAHNREATVVVNCVRSTISQSRPPAPGPTEPVELPPDGPAFGDWAVVARIGVQVAEALAYAHQNGVLHRDVKPANLLLDDRKQVWVADFGLAKLGDQHGLTTTGHILGTLQYLAPECLQGEADARSDVYGLGATLYELLTLSPPFVADSPGQLMKLIAEKDPPSPRAINPAIPRDLDTIILTALAREPRARYATAGDFADDLQAFLEDRPIKARRSTCVDRGWRWCRRNPAIAGLASATLAALVIGSAIGWIGYARANTAFHAEEHARHAEAEKRAEAVAASDRAEAALHKLEVNLQLSLEAFEKVFEAVGGDEIRPGQGQRPSGPPTGEAAEKAAVLEAVLGFYDKFADQNVTDPRLRLEAAKAHRRVGELHRRLGRDEKAITAARRAAAILDGLVAEYSADNMRYELCLVYAHSPESAGWTEEQLREGIIYGSSGNGPVARWSIGAIQYRLGRLLEGRGDQSGAEEAYRDAVDRLAGERGGVLPPQLAIERALAWQRLAGFAIAADDWQVARQKLEGAEGDLWRLAGHGGPPNRAARELLIAISTQLASVLDQLGDRAAADHRRRQADHLRNEPFDDRPPPKGPNPPPKQGGPKDFPPPPKR